MTRMHAWAKISRADNGWVVEGEKDGLPSRTVFADDPDAPSPPYSEELFYARSLHRTLWQVIEYLDASGDARDPERVVIGLTPGDRFVPLTHTEEEREATDPPGMSEPWGPDF